MADKDSAQDQRARNEHIKEASGYLRGTLADGLLAHATGAISEDDGQLVKFHGMYLQDDRDLRAERTAKKLEKAFSFMVRLRIPGGVLTPAQWLALDGVARTYANGSLRVTTRQTFQFHGVIKSNLKRTMREIDRVPCWTPSRPAATSTATCCPPPIRTSPARTKRPTTWRGRSPTSCCPRPARGARSGWMARRSWAGRTSRSTARPTCRGSSRR